MFKKEIDFINSNTEKYDKQYGLNNDLLEKVNTYRNDLNKYLAAIHRDFFKYYELLDITDKID